MKNPEKTLLPFSGNKKVEDTNYIPYEKTPIFNLFSAKRNAAGIEHYFINTRYTRKCIVKVGILVVIYISIIFASRLLEINKFRSIHQKHTKDMINSTQSFISRSILATIREPFYFSNFFADFFKGSTYTINLTNGQLFVKLFGRAHTSGSGDIIWWDIGTVNGDYFSIESPQPGSKKVTILYANGTNDEATAPLHEWITDENGYNASFPDSGGTYISDARLMDRVWYSTVKSTKEPFTDIHQADSQYKSLMMLTNTAPQLDQNGNFVAAFNNGIPIENFQIMIESLVPSKNSHIALIASDDVVARDGMSLETYNNTLLLQNIQSIEDIEWMTATTNPKFGKSFAFTVNKNDTELTYNSDVVSLDVVGGTNWELATLLCINDFITTNTVYGGSYIVLVVLLIVTIVINISYLLINRMMYANSRKNILHTSKHGECHYIEARESLRTLKKTHNDIEGLTKFVNSMAKSFNESLFYNTDRVIGSINDSEIRELFKKEYTEIRDIPSLCTEKRERMILCKKRYNICIEEIFKYFSYANNNFIDDDILRNIVKEATLSLRPELIPLLADSMNFVLSIASIKYERCFSIYLCLLSFYLALNTHEKDATSILTYCVTDVNEMINFALILYQKIENYIKKDSIESISDMLMKLVIVAPRKEHKKTLIEFDNFPSEEGLIKVISNSAQVSFLYRTNFTYGGSFRLMEQDIKSFTLLPSIEAINYHSLLLK